MSDQGHYSIGLDKTPANFVPLSPLSFLERSAAVYPNLTSAVYEGRVFTWGQTYERCRRFASFLAKRGIGRGDTVAAMLPNIPAMNEVHFAVPMTGAVLNTLNIRLEAEYHRLPARPWRRKDHPGRSGIYRRDFRSAGADEGSEACCHRRRRRGFCRRKADRRDRIRRRRVARRPQALPQGRRKTNGTPSRSATPPEPPAIPRASLPTTAAPISTPSATSWPATSASIRSICGRCRCFIATAGAFHGPSRRRRASTFACARWTRRKSLS